MSQKRLVSWKQLKEIYGLPYCRQHISRLEDMGQFPKRLKLGNCRVAWLVEEVEAWISSKLSDREHSSRE